ncbi:Cohesin domain [Seminavis robusta]|uniref:Cohesin domain n=1 Tax=Seminavis robusta TaxID=568900 RepID=A0A9N8E5N2_9STRA|nr:Cohesin domain [Seminavis robusta]|eukprot:Sro697_g189100.1 Cohesin domain (1359) ;mRNA; r:37582-41846
MIRYQNVVSLLVCLRIVQAGGTPGKSSFLRTNNNATLTSRRLTRVDAHTVQPFAGDEVHTVWIHGPSHKAQLGGYWPGLGDTVRTYPAGHACDPQRDAYTGYHDNGAYCQVMNDHFEKNPHLVVHSGNLGMVLDASAAQDGTLVRQLGAVTEGQSTEEIYETLPYSNACATLTLMCTNLTGIDYSVTLTAGLEPDTKAKLGLIRQGHAVTHIDVRELHWLVKETGQHLRKPECDGLPEEPVQDPSNENCNTDYGIPYGRSCQNPDYPICADHIQGQQWGKCYSDPSICNLPFPKPWLETILWPDLVAFHLHWNGTEGIAEYGCTGQVQFSVAQGDKVITKTDRFETGSTLAVLLTTKEGTSVLQESSMAPHDLDVTSTKATVLARDSYQDILVDVPQTTARCGYHYCEREDMIDVSVGNPKDEPQTIRLSLTRNFPTFMEDVLPRNRNRIGAEITGFNVIIMDASGIVPLGIPGHISKNWHHVDGFKSYYSGVWWTYNVFLRLPPKAKIDLQFKIVYEKYGGVSAFSHAQLSIVGYSNKWLWEEAALGTGGENFCMDPLGSHTRAPITDVRVKLFDGKWKENVGGGEFLLYFDDKGVMQSSKKGLDAQLHANGPCLSNATYTSVTIDGAIQSRVQVSGGRTDDLVRMFIHLRYTVVNATQFSRLVFFQMGSETYNKHAVFGRFVFGAGDQVTHNFARTCTGRTALYREKLYDRLGVYRENLPAHGPWWFSMAPTEGPAYDAASETMVVGNRGLVIREFDARLHGQSFTSPSISVLCDKLEVGTPKGISELIVGDYVDMKLEMVVNPQIGADFDAALSNSGGSRSLQVLNNLPEPWERVQAQATYHIQVREPVPQGARVESQYPIRVCVPDYTDSVEFKVFGKALGYVPIVICGLSSARVENGQGLWYKIQGKDDDYTLLQDATIHRQVNYDRETGRYELVFNVEIQTEDQCTIFAFVPSNNPTYVPTGVPSKVPTPLPTTSPSTTPTTLGPTTGPTDSPTFLPTTLTPTLAPTSAPFFSPTIAPTTAPTVEPTERPTTLSPSITSGHPSASPTTGSPTGLPTGFPIAAPTNAPTGTPLSTPTRTPTGSPRAFNPSPTTPSKTGGMFGDPHILTWSGSTFDFHGACDLVLATNPRLDMDIHVRTRIHTWWSFIYTAAVRIGTDTLEVQGGKDKNLYWINGKAGGPIEHGTTLSQTISGCPIHFRWTSGGQRQFRLDLHDGDAVFFKTYGDFVRVNVHVESDGKFQGSLGLMGSYPDGQKLARDNSTVIEDVNQFGQEWQTQFHEPQLFHQHERRRRRGRRCQMPRTNNAGFLHRKRRLLEGQLSREEAEAACAHVQEAYLESCVHDVLATGQRDLAGSY